MFLRRSLRSISFVSIFPLRNHRTESLDGREAQPVIYLTVKDISYRCSECENFHDFKKICQELAGFHVLSNLSILLASIRRFLNLIESAYCANFAYYAEFISTLVVIRFRLLSGWHII